MVTAKTHVRGLGCDGLKIERLGVAEITVVGDVQVRWIIDGTVNHEGREAGAVEGGVAQKELLAYLVAHNLMRCIMAQAAVQHEVDLERVSCKGTVDAVRQYSHAIGQVRNRKLRRQLWEDLLLNLARDLVRRRPNRTEPRAVKHRPKPYPLLNQPRHRFVEISHRSDYWKGRARDYRRLN